MSQFDKVETLFREEGSKYVWRPAECSFLHNWDCLGLFFRYCLYVMTNFIWPIILQCKRKAIFHPYFYSKNGINTLDTTLANRLMQKNDWNIEEDESYELMFTGSTLKSTFIIFTNKRMYYRLRGKKDFETNGKIELSEIKSIKTNKTERSWYYGDAEIHINEKPIGMVTSLHRIDKLYKFLKSVEASLKNV